MRVARTKTTDQIVKDVKEHIKYFKSVSRSIAKKPPRGRVKDSVRKALTQGFSVHRKAKALDSSRKKLATLEARLAKRVQKMKRKSWGKVKKRRKRGKR